MFTYMLKGDIFKMINVFQVLIKNLKHTFRCKRDKVLDILGCVFLFLGGSSCKNNTDSLKRLKHN